MTETQTDKQTDGKAKSGKITPVDGYSQEQIEKAFLLLKVFTQVWMELDPTETDGHYLLRLKKSDYQQLSGIIDE